MVKEATGHKSDAVDKFQVTSDQQREQMSKVIACPKPETCSKVSKESETEENSTVKSSKIDVCTCQEGTSNIG